VELPVQNLAMFDLANGNADRNLGNMLYDRATSRLTPIDHGLTLLDSIDWLEAAGISETSCHWLLWPQIKKPTNEKAKNWILEYNVEAKCRQLADIGIPPSSIRDHKLRMIFLKTAVQKGFTIEEMGKLCMQTSETRDEPTWLDKQVRTTLFSLNENDLFKDEKLFYQQFKNLIEAKLADGYPH
jgi:hypothetical protein